MPTRTQAGRKGSEAKGATTSRRTGAKAATAAAPKRTGTKAAGARAAAAAAKTATKKGDAGGGRANALQKPLTPSAELAAVVGDKPLPRTEVVSKVWDYIKSKNLQNPENKREILADEVLGKVFGKDRVTMFEMNKHLARHLS